MKIKNIFFLLCLFCMVGCVKSGGKVSDVPLDAVVSDGTVVNNALDYYSCGAQQTVALIAPTGTIVGQMAISNNWNAIKVTITTTGNWILDKSKLFVGYSQDIPKNNNGTIKYSQLPYLVAHPWDTQEYTLTVTRNGSLNGVLSVVFSYDVLRVNKSTCSILETKNICDEYIYLVQNCVEI